MPIVTGAPYSGEQVMETLQVLADGTRIAPKMPGSKTYRDSSGRVRSERSMGRVPGRAAEEAPVIVEITDPEHPRFVRFIPGPPNTWALQVQIAEGRMITSLERIADGWGGDTIAPFDEGFLIWDLADPEKSRAARPL